MGMLQTNGSRMIMRIVKPGPDDDTTSSIPERARADQREDDDHWVKDPHPHAAAARGR